MSATDLILRDAAGAAPQDEGTFAVIPGPRADAHPAMTLVSRLRLPLALPSGLIDLDRYRQGFHAAAIAGAAHRRGTEIIEADGDAGMRVGGADAVCRIEPDPAEIRHERLRPGVAGLLIDHPVGAQEMSGNEARGNAGAARARDKDMRIVLAHPALQCEGFHRRGTAVGGVLIEGHVL